jgi:hypothetical protein
MAYSKTMLKEMFSGEMQNTRMFPSRFKDTLQIATLAYPEAKMSIEKEGVRFYQSPPPISKKILPTTDLPPKKLMPDSIAGSSAKFYTKPKPTQTYTPETMELLPLLDPETYEDAKRVAPGYDVYSLEKQWRTSWKRNGKKFISNPDMAFIGYCKACNKNNPLR